MKNFKLLIIIFNFALLTILLPQQAEAGLIVQRPLYIGLTNGLVGYWSFDGTDIAGERAYDKSGNGNTGLLTNGPVRRAGRIGQALEFDGSNDLINAGSNASLDQLSAFTVSAWIKKDTTAKTIIAAKNGAGTDGWDFVVQSGGSLRFNVTHATIDLIASTNATVGVGTWRHVVVGWDGSTVASQVRFYIDGTESSHAADINAVGSRSDDSTDDLLLGAERTAASPLNLFDGLIDEVRIYNRVLSSDEIKRLYKIGATLKLGKPVAAGLDNGLVGYWTFDGPDMAGVTAYDRSGQNNTGTLTNGPVRRAGRIGQALEFDKVDDQVNVGSPSNLDDLGPLTAVAWIYPRSPGETNVGRIVSKDDAISAGHWRFDSDASFRLRFLKEYSGTDMNVVSAANTVVLNTWQHVAVTWDGSDFASGVRVYLNGTEVSYFSKTNPSGSKNSDAALNLRIGNISDSSLTFDGLIDEVRVYNRVLSPDEIKRLYKIGATLKINKPQYSGLDNGLVGYWTFDGPDMAGVTAYDRSGQNNTGTLTNGPVRRAGRIGQALEFPIAPDDPSVNAGSAANLDNLSAISASAWIYPRSEGGTNGGGIIGKTNWELDLSPSGGDTNVLRFTVDYDTTALLVKSANNAYSRNVWQHVVLTWDGSTSATNARLYVNGTEVSYKTQTNGATSRVDDSSRILLIGKNNAANAEFDGLIDEVRVYNRVLSVDEIKRLYNMGR